MLLCLCRGRPHQRITFYAYAYVYAYADACLTSDDGALVMCGSSKFTRCKIYRIWAKDEIKIDYSLNFALSTSISGRVTSVVISIIYRVCAHTVLNLLYLLNSGRLRYFL